MQIHNLNTKALTDPAYVAFDDGTDTYKAEFNEVVADAAAAAVADVDLTDNEVAFTSGDALSPTAWTNVDVLTTGSTLATLFNKISTMIKNIRYIHAMESIMVKRVDIAVTDVTVPANGQVLLGQTPAIDGYIAIGACFRWSSSGNTNVSPTGLQYQSSNYRVRAINTSSSAATVSGTLHIFFLKGGFWTTN